MKTIPYGKQRITKEDVQAVTEALTSELITQGPIVPSFEQALCDYTQAQFAVAVNSGTSALHIACMALNLGKNDWLWTTPISFVASSNCALYCGAKVDFVDINSETWNIDVSCLHQKLIKAKKDNRLPKILVAVHLCGLSCEMQEILNLSKVFGFKIIEDASHAIGGMYKDKPIGSGKYSDITVFSFHPVKTITTGEGGAALTNRAALSDKMRLLRSHGITKDENLMLGNVDGDWHYQQLYLGYNYRLTDIQAALGCSQLKRLKSIIRKRQKIASNYDKLLNEFDLKKPYKAEQHNSANHLYVIRVNRLQRKNIFDFLRHHQIGVNVHYMPIYRHPFYQKNDKHQLYSSFLFPESEKYYAEAITLPLYPELKYNEQQYIVSKLKEALQVNK